MTDQEKKVVVAKAEVFKALGHPARLWIAEQLSDGEKCVCEFVDALGLDFSTVSKHLTVLRQAGIVQSRKEGKQMFYSLKVPCLLNFMHCVEAVLENSAKEQVCLIKGTV